MVSFETKKKVSDFFCASLPLNEVYAVVKQTTVYGRFRKKTEIDYVATH